MADFLIDGKVVEVKGPWVVFIVYGSFIEPIKGHNFVVVRMPVGRQPWKKKIVPAIHRLVSPWFPKGNDHRWNVDGESVMRPGERRLWDTKIAPRYEWNGTKLVSKGVNR